MRLLLAILLASSCLASWGQAYKLGVSHSEVDFEPSNVGVVGLRYLHKRGSMSTVVEVYPHTPAEEAGIIPGDKIVSVDGIDISRYDANQVYELIAGNPGSTINLSFLRCNYNCHRFQTDLVRMDMNELASRRVFEVYKYGY